MKIRSSIYSIKKQINTIEYVNRELSQPSKKTTKIKITTMDPSTQIISVLYELTSLPYDGFPARKYKIQTYAPYLEEGDCIECIRLILEDDVDKFIKLLIDKYLEQYILAYTKWVKLDGSYYCNLTYRQVKSMLSFEKKACRFPASLHPATQSVNPILIDGCISLSYGAYTITSLNKSVMHRGKHSYSCTTQSPEIMDWIKTL